MPKINKSYNKTFSNHKNQEYRQKIRDSMKPREPSKEFTHGINKFKNLNEKIFFETNSPILKNWGKHTRDKQIIK
jgi:hypothetical protein